MKTTRHIQTSCPGCGHRLNASAGQDSSPNPGDVSVCLECGQPLSYTENLSLRALSTEEVAELERQDPDAAKTLEWLRKEISRKPE